MRTSSPYWKEALEIALDEAGLFGVIPPDKIEEIACALTFAAEMESEATGRLNIPNPLKAEIDNIKRRHSSELADAERREDSLKGSIGRRLNLDPSRIGVDQNGEITYTQGRTTIIG